MGELVPSFSTSDPTDMLFADAVSLGENSQGFTAGFDLINLLCGKPAQRMSLASIVGAVDHLIQHIIAVRFPYDMFFSDTAEMSVAARMSGLKGGEAMRCYAYQARDGFGFSVYGQLRQASVFGIGPNKAFVPFVLKNHVFKELHCFAGSRHG